MTYNPDSIHEEAMTDTPARIFGQLSIDVWRCILVKGQGKVPATGAEGERSSIVVTMVMTPIDPSKPIVTREPITWTTEWRSHTRPSIEALAPTLAKIKGLREGQFSVLKELDGAFVSADLVPRSDNKPGETWTAFQFVEVFPDEASCRRGAQATATTSPEEVTSRAVDPERAALAAFLPPLWAQAQRENPFAPVAKFMETIEANPLLVGKFVVSSPEVQALIAREGDDIPF